MSNLEYHLQELEIAKDINDSRRTLPDLLPSDQVIVDIGCGIGQTFIALECTDRTCIGIDVDAEVINYGIEHFGADIDFYLTDAINIPLQSNSVDLVISRVALPYTNIPKVLKSVRRVLKEDGRIWFTIHSDELVKGWLKKAVKKKNYKDVIHKVYVRMNGYLLKNFGVLIPFVNGNYESWQDEEAIIKILKRNGIVATKRQIGDHTCIEGQVTARRQIVND